MLQSTNHEGAFCTITIAALSNPKKAGTSTMTLVTNLMVTISTTEEAASEMVVTATIVATADVVIEIIASFSA